MSWVTATWVGVPPIAGKVHSGHPEYTRCPEKEANSILHITLESKRIVVFFGKQHCEDRPTAELFVQRM